MGAWGMTYADQVLTVFFGLVELGLAVFFSVAAAIYAIGAADDLLSVGGVVLCGLMAFAYASIGLVGLVNGLRGYKPPSKEDKR